ncbi:TniQ family protein [Paenibacillus oleatilyticus]|uniref:TniQ family protein n=1 Tax=Paenibacillus oleatilyticus TaxID=2594886 RepID=A0ABV4UYP8_9BACL
MILPKRPIPFFDESLSGYIFRLASANHFENPLPMFQLSGLTMPGYLSRIACTTILRATQSLERLSILCNYSSDSLRNLTFCESEGRFVIYGNETIPENAIHNLKSKVCPMCLSESPMYSRKVWELCERHLISLIDSCPSCKKTISWQGRNIIDFCKCGFDFKKVVTETPQQNVIDLSNHIGQAQKQYIDKNASWITVNRINVSNCYLQNLLGHVLHIFTNWPLNYYEFLKNYETNETDNKTGLRKSFGYFYYNLYRSFLSYNFNFLREEFENFVGNSFNV